MSPSPFLPNNGWGNYALKGIVEVQLPETVSFYPETPGWWLLLLGLVIYGVLRLYKAGKNYWLNRYRRDASFQLSTLQKRVEQGDLQALRGIPALIKATALYAYPRTDVANLHGNQWDSFLDNNYNGSAFSTQFSGLLSALSYQPYHDINARLDEEFWRQLQLWIMNHHGEIE